MVSTTLIILTVLIQAIGLLTTWLYWLQTKEYRLDRFLVFLKSVDGKRELFIIPTILKYLIFLLSSINIMFIYFYLLEIIVLSIYFLLLVTKKKLRKPVFTKRLKVITFITLFSVSLSLLVLIQSLILGLIIVELILIIGPVLGVYYTSFSVKRTLEIEKAQAIKKLERISPTVIAITGSYGKTTTKDFITQLLSSKYKTLSTYKNQNTHFGIIRRVNSELEKDFKFFVVEIGAYKKGEIKSIASWLKPDCAVITGLEPQHLDLFGSFENLKEAKFELVEYLKSNGLVFFNVTNPDVRSLLDKTKELDKEIRVYSYASNLSGKQDAVSKIVSSSVDGSVINITIGGKTKKIETNIASKRLMENLTGAILVARKFGVDWQRIRKVCKKLILPEGTLKVFKTANKLTVINDSYNSTPHGFEAAVELLDRVEGNKKILVTSGIIELGRQSDFIHRKISRLVDKVCDEVVLRNKQFYEAFRSGLRNKSKLKLITENANIINYLESNLHEGTVILVEGKLPQVIAYFEKGKIDKFK